jgi:hypothetical protein
MVDEEFDRPCPLAANDPEFPDGCHLDDLALREDVAQVLVDGARVFAKQLADLRLRKPQGLPGHPALDRGVRICE